MSGDGWIVHAPPDHGDLVLITRHPWGDPPDVELAYWCDGEWWAPDSGVDPIPPHEVRAWMERPEPHLSPNEYVPSAEPAWAGATYRPDAP